VCVVSVWYVFWPGIYTNPREWRLLLKAGAVGLIFCDNLLLIKYGGWLGVAATQKFYAILDFCFSDLGKVPQIVAFLMQVSQASKWENTPWANRFEQLYRWLRSIRLLTCSASCRQSCCNRKNLAKSTLKLLQRTVKAASAAGTSLNCLCWALQKRNLVKLLRNNHAAVIVGILLWRSFPCVHVPFFTMRLDLEACPGHNNHWKL